MRLHGPSPARSRTVDALARLPWLAEDSAYIQDVHDEAADSFPALRYTTCFFTSHHIIRENRMTDSTNRNLHVLIVGAGKRIAGTARVSEKGMEG
jgi:hypothetical protein